MVWLEMLRPLFLRCLLIWVTFVGHWSVQETDAAPLIFFANVDSIRYIDIDKVSEQGVVVSGLTETRSLALYVRERWLFWSEYGNPSTISRLRLIDGSTREVILTGLGEVDDMAIEWETGLIYWTDYMHETVEVSRIDGSHRKTLIWENIANPRAIVVDARTGYMYWSERGWDFPKIERATLAGKERIVVMDGHGSFSPQIHINSLVIDFKSDLLYWVDAGQDAIEHIELDGSNRQEFKVFSSVNLYSFSLTLYDDMLYASDLNSRSIERVRISTNEHYRNMGWLTNKKTYGIALNDSSREPQGMTDCKTNIDCSHLCLLTPTGGTCACSNGYVLLPDDKTCNASAPTTRPPIQAIEIRLMKGNIQSNLEGRVEVRLAGNSKWGTVCDDHFDLRDAKVVCRMLNHTGADRVFRPASEYDEVSDDVNIWLDNLKCRGTENSLMECRHRGWGISNCNHYEDVGVVCKNDSIPTAANATSPTVGPPKNISVRLQDGTANNNGRVEVLYNGMWGTVCDNDWDIQDAHVVCRMLGFEGAWSTQCCAFYGSGWSQDIWMDNVHCSGKETSLAECAHGGWGNHDDVCTHSNDAGVYCIPKPIVIPDATVRLADGTSANEGRVEIFHVGEQAGEQRGEWGTICDDRWDLKDAAVICRMLNYSGALAAPMSSAYGEGLGKILLDDLDCVGNESSIKDCPHGGWENHNCFKDEIAGVICQANDSALPSYDTKKGLLFAEFKRGILYQVDMESDSLMPAPLPIDHRVGPTAVGFDPVEKVVYYSESALGIIRRSFLNGTADETIINGVYTTHRLTIAIDYVTRNIYFTDNQRNRIDVAAINGIHRSSLISTPWPEGIALDLKNGYIYWSSNGYPPRIERADMDGTNQLVILELSEFSYPVGLTVHHYAADLSRLYFIDRLSQEVYYIGLGSSSSSSFSIPFISNGVIDPIELTILGNTLYLTDAGGGGKWDGGVYSAVLGGPGNVSKVIDLIDQPLGIDSYDMDFINITGSRGCAANCSHLCLNSPSGPHCACPKDMEPISDTTCIFRSLILHTECHFSEIYKSPLGGDDLFYVASSVFLKHASCPNAIASNPAEKKLYWTDLTFKHIARVNLDGTQEEVIVQNVGNSLALAVDSYGGNIYFTDKDTRTVEVAKLDGSNRKVLIRNSTHQPVGLAIDSSRGYMYYSAWGDPPMIVRAELDGSQPTVLVQFSSAVSQKGPSALAIDVDENLLYWVGYQDPSLQYIDLRYPHSEIAYHIDSSVYLLDPISLALDAHYFYWIDDYFGSVVRASRKPDKKIVQLIGYQISPRGVNIYNPSDVQAFHPCVDICSHLCLIKPGGYKCACPNNDTAMCSESININNVHGCAEDPSMYFADHHSIKCIDMKSFNNTFVNVKTVKTGLAKVGAIDIDHRERMIYWSDRLQYTISRMSLVTGETEVIIRDDLGQVEGIAVEWESGLIYWTDYIYERIEVAKLDGSSRKTLFTSSLFYPRGIAVDPKSGYMYWADMSDREWLKIERADLTGENRKSSVNLYWQRDLLSPGVVIDYEADRIFSMVAGNNSILSTNLDGADKRNTIYSSRNIYPTDLALYGDNLYWVDRNSRSIQWLNKTQPLIMLNFGHLTDIELVGAVVSDQSRQPVASPMNRPPCRVNNGGCSHLCLLVPGGGHKCACPNGVELKADHRTCNKVTRPGPPPAPVPDVKVRLRGSNSTHEGRVEVYHQGRWGTICDDDFGIRESAVVCRMLNYSSGVKVVKNAYRHYGRVNSSYPIWMDNVKCRGDEQSIAACRHNGWNIHDCDHFKGVGVVCSNGSSPSKEGWTSATGPPPELKVRLRHGPTSNQGRVELSVNGTWGTICDDYWGIEEANVICRMLGYSQGAWSTHCCGWYRGSYDLNKVWLDDVHCVGDEKSIAECSHGGWGRHNCYLNSQDVGVVCKYTLPEFQDETLRLVDGYRDGEGRVEVFLDGHWGTVCDDFWDIKDAQVVCRQLGYYKAVAAPTFGTFGEGNGHIWLDNVQCLGNESSLERCPKERYPSKKCSHREDASVVCTNSTETLGEGDNFLLLCEGGSKMCYSVSLLSETPPYIVTPLFELNSAPNGISYDPVEKRIYWTDSSGHIRRVFVNNGSSENVIRGLETPMGIEIDATGRIIYFCDQGQDKIKVSTLDGSIQAVIVDVPSPQGIALDGTMGYMYFSSVGSSPRILRADMDGNNTIVIADLSTTGPTIVDVVLDKPGNRLFFSDQSNNVIRYIDLGSMEINTLLSGDLHHPRRLAMLNDTLYWTTQGNGEFSGAVFKAEATNESSAQMIADGFSYPDGVYALNARQIREQSPCENNGGCSQLCVLSPHGRKCLCQFGYKIAEDRRNCNLGDVIFVAGAAKVYLATLSSLDNNPVSLPVQDIGHPNGIAFDPFDNHLYWTDYSRGIVTRASLAGLKQEIIHSGVDKPYGIALDLLAENVYWISGTQQNIKVSKLNGNYSKVLISDLKAYDIALDNTRGYMYWTAYGIIERAEMDGATRNTVASLVDVNGDSYLPKGLALDVYTNRIYFATTSRLLYIDLDNSRGHVQELFYSRPDVQSPGAVELDDQFVYWSEFLMGKVYRINKTRWDGNLEEVVTNLIGPKGMAVKKGIPTRKLTHPCSSNSANCSHLCLIKPNGYQCACPDEDDGRKCLTLIVSPPPTTTQTPTTFTSAQPTTRSSTTNPVDYCALSPCENGASCAIMKNGYKCYCKGYYGGKTCTVDLIANDAVVQVNMRNVALPEFNINAFIQVVVDILNELCRETPGKCPISVENNGAITKREIQDGPFTPDDIYIPSDPKEVDGGISVEYAVVKTSGDGKHAVVPSKVLAAVTEQKAAEIGRKLGLKVADVKRKMSATKPQTREDSSTGKPVGMIAGVAVAVGLTVIIAAIGIWHLYRVKKKRALAFRYEKNGETKVARDPNTSFRRQQISAFENPGYEGTRAMGVGGKEDYAEVEAGNFSIYEEIKESGAVTQSAVTEISMVPVLATENSNAEEGIDEPSKQEPSTTKKEEEEKLEYLTSAVQKEKETQEDPSYEMMSPEGEVIGL